MKSQKTRITIYLLILTALVLLVFALLLTGYDYSKSAGFYLAEDRVPMELVEVVAALPSKLLFPLLFFISIIGFIELIRYVFLKARSKNNKNH